MDRKAQSDTVGVVLLLVIAVLIISIAGVFFFTDFLQGPAEKSGQQEISFEQRGQNLIIDPISLENGPVDVLLNGEKVGSISDPDQRLFLEDLQKGDTVSVVDQGSGGSGSGDSGDNGREVVDKIEIKDREKGVIVSDMNIEEVDQGNRKITVDFYNEANEEKTTQYSIEVGNNTIKSDSLTLSGQSEKTIQATEGWNDLPSGPGEQSIDVFVKTNSDAKRQTITYTKELEVTMLQNEKEAKSSDNPMEVNFTLESNANYPFDAEFTGSIKPSENEDYYEAKTVTREFGKNEEITRSFNLQELSSRDDRTYSNYNYYLKVSTNMPSEKEEFYDYTAELSITEFEEGSLKFTLTNTGEIPLVPKLENVTAVPQYTGAQKTVLTKDSLLTIGSTPLKPGESRTKSITIIDRLGNLCETPELVQEPIDVTGYTKTDQNSTKLSGESLNIEFIVDAKEEYGRFTGVTEAKNCVKSLNNSGVTVQDALIKVYNVNNHQYSGFEWNNSYGKDNWVIEGRPRP